MSEMVQVQAVVRVQMLDRVVHRLKQAGVPRLTVCPVHAIGAGVDPSAAKVSRQEGSEYAEKALIQFICACEHCQRFAEVITGAARTGCRGDGIVSVHPVLNVTKIRTGVCGLSALV